jgi:hypothetical protein
MAEFKPRDEAKLVTLDPNDRRRLAQSAVIMELERAADVLQPLPPMAFGNAIKAFAKDENEVLLFGDMIVARLNGQG